MKKDIVVLNDADINAYFNGSLKFGIYDVR